MLYTLVVAALFYGICMKIADLLNEHGLKWFKYSDVLFGVLWGSFGAAIVYYGDSMTGSLILAMNLAFLVRSRLDFINHQLATLIIVLASIYVGRIDVVVLLVFTAVFWLFGGLKDQMDNRLQKYRRHWIGIINEAMLYYPIPTLILGIILSNYVPFVIFTVYTISYDATKLLAARRGYK